MNPTLLPVHGFDLIFLTKQNLSENLIVHDVKVASLIEKEKKAMFMLFACNQSMNNRGNGVLWIFDKTLKSSTTIVPYIIQNILLKMLVTG